MKVKINETGEIKKLAIWSGNGVNYVQDVIQVASNEDFVHDEGTDIYSCNLETYDWWYAYCTEYMANEDDRNELFGEIYGKYDYEEAERIVAKFWNAASDFDMCTVNYTYRKAIEEFRKEFLYRG